MVNTLKSRAFTLIEVIFAIVIMGITIVSLPVMMSSNEQATDLNMVQEAIFGASSELNEVLSYRWDENSLNEVTDPNGLSKVIGPGTGTGILLGATDCDNNNSSIMFRLRPGHIAQPLHRRCLESNVSIPSAILGADGDIDDIDDINVSKKSMFLNVGTAAGYKQNFSSEFTINYVDVGTVTAASENAKLIEITIKKQDGTIITKLRSYTFNIGEVDIYKETY